MRLHARELIRRIENRLRRRIVQHHDEPLLADSEIERDDHGAGFQNAIHDFRIFDAITHQDRDA